MSDGIIHISGRAELAKGTIDRQRRDHEGAKTARTHGSRERPDDRVSRNHYEQYSENTIWPALHGPNENKMSDGRRESAWLRVDGAISWKVTNQSCQPFAPSLG